MKTMNKEKVKEYLKEHKKDVAITVVNGVIAAGLFVAGYKYCAREHKLRDAVLVTHDGMKNVLLDACDKYKNVNIFTGINESGIKYDELGELGNAMSDLGDTAKETAFTHFIAIGKEVK